MALSRRDLLLGLPACAGTLLGCTRGQHERSARTTDRVLFSTRTAGDGAPSILVCMPDTRQTREVWTGLADELSKDFQLVAVRTEGEDMATVIARSIRQYRPAGLVLMNNPTVDAYREYQLRARLGHYPPAVVVMSSFLEGRPRSLSAATGISYEVPLITVVTNLRKLVATPIERIGVVHRGSLAGFVERQAALAGREQTRVIREEVSQKPNASEIKRALRRLKQHSDALWVLNDDRLLTPRLIADGWIRGLNEEPWVPTIVGAASLVSARQSFGTFAVLPDHTALGTQAANLMLDIADQGFTVPDDAQVELPLSTTTIVDLPQVKERFQLRANALSQVDRVVDH